ncbi:MAG TPA: DUF3177 family protein [Oculatellaceae cyanobacterium]|jgi:hypothetical protein
MQNESWLRALAWTDYRLAILFTVIIPLILLIWAFAQKSAGIQRLLMIYWRVSSLLLITVYLMIASWPIAFLSSLLARILIPISLWFWVDINEEIDDMQPRPLKLAVQAWRWAITTYCILGTIAIIPFLPCAFSQGLIKTSYCQVWLEAPWLYKAFFHANSRPDFLGGLGMFALIIYVFLLSYFVLVRLGKQGRSALQQ